MKHGSYLGLDRCPHCNIAVPSLELTYRTRTADHAGDNQREWGTYRCHSCGGLVLASSTPPSEEISEVMPSPKIVSDEIPAKAREFLSQANSSIHAPAGAVMLAASAVDAMLKDKNFKQGSLYSRIDEAAAAHLITAEMAAWAHDIRLDANDQRHADEGAPLPDAASAAKAVEFAMALAQFLYVLPARVERGRRG